MKNYDIKKKATLYKYLISFIFSFLVPFFILFFFFYPKTTTIVEEQSIESAQNTLELINSNLSMQSKMIFNYSASIYTNPDLGNSIFINDDGISIYTITEEMKKILNHDLFINSAILYNKSSGRIYTKNGSYRQEEFNNQSTNMFYYLNWSFTEMTNTLKNLTQILYRPQETVLINSLRKSVVTLVIPIPVNNIHSYTNLIFLIEADKFFPKSIINDFQNNGNILLISPENEILSSQNPDLMIDSNVLNTFLISHKSNYTGKITSDNTEYLICLKYSMSSSLRLINVIPYSSILGKIKSIKLQTLIISLVIMFIGFCLIVFLMRINYAPIHRIRENFNRQMDFSQNNLSKFNDLDAIKYAFENLHQNRNELSLKIRQISQDLFLLKYLNGTIRSEDHLTLQAKENNISIRSNLLCIAFYSNTRDRQLLNSSLLKIESSCSNFEIAAPCYIFEDFSNADKLMLLFFDNETEIKPYIYELYKLDTSIKVGIGTTEKLDLPTHSHTMSLLALEAAIFDDTMHVAFNEDIKIESVKIIREIYEKINMLDVSIMKRDTLKISKNFNELLHIISNSIKRVSVLNIIYNNIYNLIVRGLKNNNYEIEYSYEAHSANFFILNEKEKLKSLHSKLINSINNNPSENSKPNTINNIQCILTYIDLNYKDSDLTLQLIADKFDFSYSNFSHYFKKEVNETFSSYLEKLRLKEAKSLLSESQLPINEIALNVGYSSPNSFTRAFKKHESLSPKQYRYECDFSA